MIDIKGGTQTWSKAQQASSFKNDPVNDMGVAERQKYFGDQDLGEILNKVADPNWVDKAKMRHVGNNKLDKDAFMKLLLAQMKNQDPTNPMKSHEMAAQLAQFSSLEKLTNINSGIDKLATTSQPKNNYQALNLIGKAVTGDSAQVIRSEGDTNHEIDYETASDVKHATIKVRGPDGNFVREVSVNNLAKGKNKFVWNGMDNDGKPVPAGEYQIVIEATDSFGKKVHAATEFSGVITGVNFAAEGPLLMIGNRSVRMSDVKKITDPMLIKNANTPATKDAGKSVKAAESNAKADTAAKGAPPSPHASGLENVAMSQGMINKLNGEVGQK